MNLSLSATWFLFVSLVGVVLAGCGAIEPPPQQYPHATVSFDVKVPTDTPANVVITVVGSEPSLGSDTAPGFRLRREREGQYTGSVRLPVGAEVSFDLWVEDAWRSEISAEGTAVPRHSFRVDGDMTVDVTVAGWGEPSQGPR
ncbi:hypothetical protein ACN28E_22615 [Archangium lansingense]|uniref:hypothetical protein n=1 Tax=Archangium lansingense TaxID=2995310 RepID=UPI003B801EAC